VLGHPLLATEMEASPWEHPLKGMGCCSFHYYPCSELLHSACGLAPEQQQLADAFAVEAVRDVAESEAAAAVGVVEELSGPSEAAAAAAAHVL
jgi:hypothetical protein